MSGAVPLHIVSGKGGTGKTTVSLALATLLARPGDEVLVCEVESRHSLTEAAGRDEIPAGEERHLFDAGSGRVSALSVDPRHALTDYLDANFRLGLAGKVLERTGFVDFATDLAPGLRDVLLIGKVYQAARRRTKGSAHAMDAVVLDAPPTGRLETFLTAGDALADVVNVGPVRSQADSIMALLRAETTLIHLVTTPSEMAMTETLEAMDAIERHGLRLGRVIVSMVRAGIPTLPDLPGLPTDVVDQLNAALTADTRELEEDQRRWIDVMAARVRRSHLPPLVQLPLLPTEIRPEMIPALADALSAQARPVRAAAHASVHPETRVSTPSAPLIAPTPELGALLTDRNTRVVVCCGTGGVGKTSVSAALALRAADAGRRVVLLTVDPAKRLATALGITALGAVPERVPGPVGEGSLDALMLDMKHTFDAAIRTHAAPGKADEVLANPFYQALSTSFSGTQDYMATEQLGQLADEARATGRWDLIVVDTPPSRSALDFLDAPERLDRLASGPLLQILAPRGPFKLLGAGVAQATKVVTQIIGGQALADLQVFATAFESVMAGFRARGDRVRSLLRSDATAFVVVSSPRRTALREASYLVNRLSAESRPVLGVIVNQVGSAVPLSPAEQSLLVHEAPLVAQWWQATADAVAAQQAEIQVGLPKGVALGLVPRLGTEVVDLDAVRELGAHVVSDARPAGWAQAPKG